jgi:flagellar assembly protein FliH
MLSRILRGTQSAEMPSFDWPAADGTSAAPRGRTAAGVAAPPIQQAPSVSQQLAELSQQLEHRATEARQAGYQEGEAAGRNQAAALMQTVIDRSANAIADMAAVRPRLMLEAEAELVDLSIAIARRILRRELAIDPSALQGLIKAALEKLAGQQICRVRAHPDLEAGLRQALERAGHADVKITADAMLEPGAILLETQRGKLDASLETQLGEIGRGLADRLPER